MKKLFILGTVFLTLVLAACGNSGNKNDDQSGNNQKDKPNVKVQPENNSAMKKNANNGAAEGVKDLKLQLQKQDIEAGVAIEDNEIYSALNDAIEANPQMGIPNDFSLFPFNISINPDGSRSLIFLAISRLKDSIKGISFDITFGNKNGEYIWEEEKVTLPGTQVGVIKPDHAVPFMLDITPEQEEIYDGLTKDKVDMKVANFHMTVVE